MSGDVKRVFSLVQSSKIGELDNFMKSVNMNWTECRHPSGDTPLHRAAQTGNILMMRYLLSTHDFDAKTVDIRNLTGKTPLHEACQNSQPEAAVFLLEKGADPQSIKQADWTPLMLACTKTGVNALTCCKVLLESAGPDLLRDKNKDGWNSFHIAAREGDISIVEELLRADKDLKQASTRSKNGRTPLHTAALHGCYQVVKHMLDLKCVDCNAKDSCGSTPIHDAVRSGSLDTLKALVEARADLNAYNNEGYGIKHMAAQTGQTHMLQYIIEELNPTSGIKLKTTPLHCAVRAGQVASMQILLDSGADPMEKDEWGRSCFEVVPERNSSQVDRVLQNAFR